VGESGRSLVSRDELIGDVVEVVADNLRPRADLQNIIADTFDQRGLPARCLASQMRVAADLAAEPGLRRETLSIDRRGCRTGRRADGHRRLRTGTVVHGHRFGPTGIRAS
jgi:hypothetical protein